MDASLSQEVAAEPVQSLNLCRRGHSMAGDNLLQYSYGSRCRACARDRSATRRAGWSDAERAAERKKWSARQRERRRDDPDMDRARNLRLSYGMSMADFDRLLASQQGRCATCAVALTREHRKANTAHVDHCHATGKVRGILCMRCNSAIGYLRDDPALAIAVSDYLKRSA